MEKYGECLKKALKTYFDKKEEESLKEEKLIKVSLKIGKDEMYLTGSQSTMQSVAGFLERLSVRIRDSTDKQNL